MIGYIAKDRDGYIYLHLEEPYYDDELEGWFSSSDILNITNEFEEFNSLNYKDKPVKVEIKLERI